MRLYHEQLGCNQVSLFSQGRWELTPVAIKAGKLLARRLFGGSTHLMNYDMVSSLGSQIYQCHEYPPFDVYTHVYEYAHAHAHAHEHVRFQQLFLHHWSLLLWG